MMPACQSLNAGDLPIFEADLWLKIWLNFLIFEGGIELVSRGWRPRICRRRAGRCDGRCFGDDSPN